MTTDIAIRQDPAALAIQPGQEMWDDKQKAALVALGIKDASTADLAVFMHYCQKTGLDPFSKQIYLIGRNVNENGKWVTKQTIQVGIGGFQVLRDRIARRLGIAVEYEDTVWFDADGGEHLVWLADAPPAACRVAVLKDGKRFPAVVRYSAYVQTTKDGKPNSMWARMGAEQLEKCAEAKALRRAFPNDLSGVYIPEEISDDVPVRREVVQQPKVTAAEILGTEPDMTAEQAADSLPVQELITTKQLGMLAGLLEKVGFGNREQDLAAISHLVGHEVTSKKQLTKTQATFLIDKLEERRKQMETTTPADDVEWAEVALIPDGGA